MSLFQIVLLSVVLALSPATLAQNSPQKFKSNSGESFEYEVLLKSRGQIIWGFDFLNPSELVFTERTGKLFHHNLKTQKTSEITGAPKVWAQGQGGLLDVRVHPSKKDTLYMTYAEPVGDGATTALGMGTLQGSKLVGFKKLFSAHEPNSNGEHFGSRIVFDEKGHVFITIGDRGARKQVQSLAHHIGKVIRLKEDGTVPDDNPYVKTKDAKPEIWAQGLRSPQGLDFHPVTGELFEAEMGPRGGDEINILVAGKNYGWPDVTTGREYYGPKIGKPSAENVQAPVTHWVPSISPSAMTFYRGDKFKTWKNNIFVATLSGMHLRRLVLADGKVTQQEELLKDLNQRYRNVRTGPDGALYVSTDDGTLARLKN